jgi:hypothetical protein
MSEEIDDQLEKSQQQLGKALERAKMGEDKDLAARVRDDGERLVRLLYGLLKMTDIHAMDNDAFLKPTHEFIKVMTSLTELLGAIHIVTVEDQVFVNDIRIRFGRAANATSLGEEFSLHQVGGISFHQPPDQPQFHRFIELMTGKPLGEPPRALMIEQFANEGLDFIDLLGVYRFRISGESAGPVKKSTERISSRAASLVEESWDNLSSNRLPNPLPLRRAVTDILENAKEDEVAGLTADVEGSNAYGAHSLKVCRLSLLIARGLGLSEEAIQDLGVSAMFHDMGYAAREGADPKKGEEGFAPPYERHAAAGARLLLKQRGFHQAKIHRALAALEHHRDYNYHGGKPAIFARILRIAEDYANMTRMKGGGFNPHEALARMASGARTRYDPHMLQVFINRMGKYPPGTLLEVQVDLEGKDYTFVMVSQSLSDGPERFGRPICRLIRLHDGKPCPEAFAKRPIDLGKKGRILGVLNDVAFEGEA